jgi:hypothetical protein
MLMSMMPCCQYDYLDVAVVVLWCSSCYDVGYDVVVVVEFIGARVVMHGI